MAYNHTPGPWIADGNEDNAATWVFDPSNKVRICTMRRCEQDWANANLIAAAPDLLAVADMVLAYSTIETPQSLVDAAHSAITKAKGK